MEITEEGIRIADHPITVDEAIELLKKYKKKYKNGGSDKLEIQVYGKSIKGYLVGSVFSIDHEDGNYCTLYCDEYSY